MRKGVLVAVAAAVAVAIAIGALVGSMNPMTETPSGANNDSSDGPRNFVVNVTDSVQVADRG
jgi:hypothetical protein